MQPPLLVVEHLSLGLGGTPILRDVNVSVGPGEIYGLIGPNGAGKSTTIAAALGLLDHERGRIEVFGNDPLRKPEFVRQRLGVLPEQNGFYEWMSAREYLAFFARLYGRRLREIEMDDLLARVGLAPRRGQAIATFSRGMKQRLGLARALLPQPDLLILDEPTNGLDPRGRREIHDVLLELSGRDGVGVLLCTHLLDDVERLCQRIGIIVDGETVAQGSIEELIRRNEALSRFKLRLTGAPPADAGKPERISVLGHHGEWWLVEVAASLTPEKAWRELLFMGWPIAEIAREGGGLEDLYLSLTEGSA